MHIQFYDFACIAQAVLKLAGIFITQAPECGELRNFYTLKNQDCTSALAILDKIISSICIFCS